MAAGVPLDGGGDDDDDALDLYSQINNLSRFASGLTILPCLTITSWRYSVVKRKTSCASFAPILDSNYFQNDCLN